MKTSNKLLIAFGLALILVPILGMTFISLAYYKTGTFKDEVRKVENFSTPTKNMVTLTAASPFQSINFADAKELGLYVQLIKDEKFGVKIPESMKDLISISVDANGQLQVNVKNKPKDNKERFYSSIYIYAPNVTEISAQNTKSLYINGETDSLTINAKNIDGFRIDEDMKVNKLTLNVTDGSDVYVRKSMVKSLILTLKNTNFETELSSFDNLSITSSGEAVLKIRGDYDEKNTFLIKNLYINTLDKADVNFENIKVTNCAGHFSDQTQVQIPAVNLNQMYKK